MDQDTLWNACEDQDLDDALQRRVEALLADPAFLAWLDEQADDAPCPCQGRHGTTPRPCGRGAPPQRDHTVGPHGVVPGKGRR